LSLLATNLQLTTECFASPLDWSYTIFTHYFSAFATDTPLGSFGDLFLHVSKLFGWVNPEYTPKQLLHAFLWCLYNATTTTTPARFLLFVPLRKKGESFKHLLSHSLVHRLFTFPPHSFSFDSPSHSLGFSARSNSAPFSLGLFLVQNAAAFHQYPIPTNFQTTFSQWCYSNTKNLLDTELNLPKQPPITTTINLPSHFKTPHKIPKIKAFTPLPTIEKPFARLLSCANKSTNLLRLGLHLLPHFWKNLPAPTKQTHYNNPNPLNSTSVATLSSALHTLCWSPLDRNPGTLFACCPQRYHTALKQLFYDDPHYEHSTLDEKQILVSWQHFHRTQKLKQFFTYKQADALPYAYALIKNKDIARSRPIVSYYKHPLKKIFNLTSRALMFLLETCSHLTHFTLPTTQHFLPQFYDTLMKRTDETIEDKHCLITFMSRSFDVKNMYTELPHTSIIAAVEWLLDEARSTKYGRHQRVHCTLRDRRNVAFQRSGGHVSLTFAQIKSFVMFDLSNVFFALGNVVLRQHNGIPMGSPTSPSLAITVCAHAEHLFHASITDFPRFLAVRYMDDIHATATYRTLDIAERQRVHAIFDQLENIYPATLTLELTGTGSTDFLETSVSYPTLPTSITQLQDPTSDSAHSFSTRNLNKNRLSLNAPLRKFARLQHSLSYRHAQQVRGALTGTFLRLPRHSSSTTTAFLSSIELLAELHLLDFQPATLTRTLRKLSFCHPNPLWSHLLCLLSLRSYTTFISSFIRSLPT
jgi:hypothetical protein